MFCKKCGKFISDDKSICPYCGADPKAVQELTNVNAMQDQPPMKFYKFMIYFSLFAAAVVSYIGGLTLVTGIQYGSLADNVYAVFPGMKVIDILYGLFIFGYATYIIFVRQALAKYKVGAPKMVAIMYIMNLASTIIYNILGSIVTQISIFSLLIENITSLIGLIIFWVVTTIYFNKREHLFIN